MSRTVLMALAVLISALAVNAQIPDQRDALKSLHLAATIDVEVSDSDFRRAAFSESQVRTDTELKLRQAGVPLDGQSEASTYPRLFVGIRAVKSDRAELYAYQIKVQVLSMVNAQLDSKKQGRYIFAAIWETESGGLIGPGRLAELRGAISDAVNDFVNDYLAANPKH